MSSINDSLEVVKAFDSEISSLVSTRERSSLDSVKDQIVRLTQTVQRMPSLSMPPLFPEIHLISKGWKNQVVHQINRSLDPRGNFPKDLLRMIVDYFGLNNMVNLTDSLEDHEFCIIS